jgi:hypothetical protein
LNACLCLGGQGKESVYPNWKMHFMPIVELNVPIIAILHQGGKNGTCNKATPTIVDNSFD